MFRPSTTFLEEHSLLGFDTLRVNQPAQDEVYTHSPLIIVAAALMVNSSLGSMEKISCSNTIKSAR